MLDAIGWHPFVCKLPCWCIVFKDDRELTARHFQLSKEVPHPDDLLSGDIEGNILGFNSQSGGNMLQTRLQLRGPSQYLISWPAVDFMLSMRFPHDASTHVGIVSNPISFSTGSSRPKWIPNWPEDLRYVRTRNASRR